MTSHKLKRSPAILWQARARFNVEVGQFLQEWDVRSNCAEDHDTAFRFFSPASTYCLYKCHCFLGKLNPAVFARDDWISRSGPGPPIRCEPLITLTYQEKQLSPKAQLDARAWAARDLLSRYHHDMEQIAELSARERNLPAIVLPTFQAFAPALREVGAEITSVPKQTFKYGETDRHKLDVYYPTKTGANETTPVLFFVYGGGFETGARTLPEPFELTYANLGAYFARRGYLTVIPDYRLVPAGVKFPDQAQDVRDAIAWVYAHPDNWARSPAGTLQPDFERVFVMGQSAGATNAFTSLTYPSLLGMGPPLPSVRGLILMSGAYSFASIASDSHVADVLAQYHSSLEIARGEAPISLVRKGLRPLAENVMAVIAEWDPDWMKSASDEFCGALDSGMKVVVAERHNHISFVHTLSTGQGEEWAEEVVEWMQNC